MRPYRERAPVPAEQPDAPEVQVRLPPPRVIVRKPGTPLVIWMLFMAVTMAIVVSQLHVR